jgi:hypothetical protein
MKMFIIGLVSFLSTYTTTDFTPLGYDRLTGVTSSPLLAVHSQIKKNEVLIDKTA